MPNSVTDLSMCMAQGNCHSFKKKPRAQPLWNTTTINHLASCIYIQPIVSYSTKHALAFYLKQPKTHM